MSSEYRESNESPGFLLWQVTNSWQREIRRALEPLGLTHPQFVLLFSCQWLNDREGTGVTQIQLAQHAKVDVNVTSQVLRSLEQRGYIKRAPHPSDTRAKIITTTASGSELASRAVRAVEAADRSFFSGLGEETGQLIRLMRRLNQE
ncbi:MarR family winged helix-turn-helix transcriptional regulator [Cohnella sp. AR92]|uniref:MarR family winged helix-turn-helix transcriptional regulator n=1 Tax=Cohnella sp. AR92 TaxID=648716 RepID=UPI000F8EEDEF|nr:MarR family transcriptional regulator [Cohnella sp. AR92]RUS46753.1 MarR family transcriptional regulator [Cohnella sp. AR92]